MTVAKCYETPTRFARYTVSSVADIPKGTILALSTPNTAAACSADNDVAGGVAWMDKDSTEHFTEIVAALDGVWGMVTSTVAPITIGNDVVIKGADKIGVYTSLDDEKGYVLGKALETISSAASGELKVRMFVR